MNKLEYGTEITLDVADIILIKDMSAEIDRQDRSYFDNNFKRDRSIKTYRMAINGFGAELAFCRLCGVLFDSSVIKEENHFLKADAVLMTGKTVDVKSTKYPYGKLIVRLGKEEKYVDIYALMTGVFPTFVFRGWASYSDIIRDELVANLGHGDAYCLAQVKLNKTLKTK